jgi:oxygen-dependent protoporphyrinogen oxidase
MPQVVIVGGGISGLALAYRLQQVLPAAEVILVEKQTRPGGTIWTERRDGFQVEIGPNGFLDTKPTTVSLCRDLGLEDRLLAASEAAGRNRYLFLDGKLHLLPNSFGSFLRTDLLSWRGKLSLLAERFRRKKADASDESIDAFARRRAGAEAADVFADALVTGIHAGDPKLLSLKAAFPRIAELEEQFGSVLKGFAQTARRRRAEAKARGQPYQRPGRMWSFREGLRLLVETLHARLRRPPVLGVTVKRIERRPDGWLVVGDGQERWPADVVVLACPAYQQAAILADLDPELAERIGSIGYNRVTVVALGYRQTDVPISVDGFGYIAPQRLRRDVLGVQWCSSIFPERAPAGLVLLRAMCGGWHRPDAAAWEDDRLLQAVRAELALAMGIRAAPVFHHVTRWERAIPQYHLGHRERVAWIEQRLGRHPRLFVGGNAYHGVALNDCTERAEVLAEQVGRHLRAV